MVGREQYDTKEGIDLFLGSLWRLNKLISLRYEAYYERGERLNEFVILGRWVLDSCGNVSEIKGDFVPKIAFPQIPDVLAWPDEFWAYIRYTLGWVKEHVASLEIDSEKFSRIWSVMGSGIPPVGIVCPECEQGWAVGDCHDTSPVYTTELLSLHEFVGKMLGEIREIFAARTDAVYRMYPPATLIARDDLDYWLGERDGIDDAYIIQEGDKGVFHIYKFFHKACRRERNARLERKYFEEIFAEAGFVNVEMVQTENQYCGCEACAPWFWVQTPIGKILIGWRKRVINIDWSETGKSFLRLFGNEEVTKDRDYIHAWGTDKAIEYLRRIWEAAHTALSQHFEHCVELLGWVIYKAGTEEIIATAEEFWQHYMNGGLIDTHDSYGGSTGMRIDFMW